jgi:hypothetical protein
VDAQAASRVTLQIAVALTAKRLINEMENTKRTPEKRLMA